MMSSSTAIGRFTRLRATTVALLLSLLSVAIAIPASVPAADLPDVTMGSGQVATSADVDRTITSTRSWAPRTAVTAGSTSADFDPAVTAVLGAQDRVDVIVRSTAAAERAARLAVLGTGGEVGIDLPIVGGFAATITSAGLDALVREAGVTGISFDGPVTLAKKPGGGGNGGGGGTEPTFPYDHFYPRTIGADQLRDRGIDGSGVGVAIIDTGVTEVPDLAGRVIGGTDMSGEEDGVDRYGHGTMLAGIIAADGATSDGEIIGVAPGAHIVPVKIAGADGSADVSNLLAALQWVVSFKDTYDIEVLNLSLGTDSSQSYLVDPLNYAVEQAWDAGIVVVASVGNTGPENFTVAKPADDPWIISVGASDSLGTVDRGDDVVTDFSARGPTRTDLNAKPDLLAPGVSVVGLSSPGSTVVMNHPAASVDSYHLRASGTSFSTAIVTGAVALLRQAHPDWTPDQIKGALLNTATADRRADADAVGHGLVDVAAAAADSNPPVANRGLKYSTGEGSLEESRGTLGIVIHVEQTLLQWTLTLVGWVLQPVTEILDIPLVGDLTAQNEYFAQTTFLTEPWTASNWYASNWYASNWYASNWYASNWYASNWYAEDWS